uniref:Corticotropin releasing hormone n=1 Tax=Gadus morhua TaxID=8049 RepID=A0A8C4ZNI6_GADMO
SQGVHSSVPASPNPESTQPQPLRVLTRLGEEYSVHLADPTDPLHTRALRLQLSRLLERKFGNIRALTAGLETRPDEEMERARRSEDPPISLDLTFHLLREMMEMSRAEQLAVQAQNNRRMMELFGK